MVIFLVISQLASASVHFTQKTIIAKGLPVAVYESQRNIHFANRTPHGDYVWLINLRKKVTFAKLHFP